MDVADQMHLYLKRVLHEELHDLSPLQGTQVPSTTLFGKSGATEWRRNVLVFEDFCSINVDRNVIFRTDQTLQLHLSLLSCQARVFLSQL